MRWQDEVRVLGPDDSDSGRERRSALVIRGGNALDPELFVRGSRSAIAALLEAGLAVYLLDVDIRRDYLYFQGGRLPERQLGPLVQAALAEVPRLARVQIYAHSRYDVNLTDLGSELSVKPIGERAPNDYNGHRVFIGDLRIGSPAGVGLVDVFGCMTRPDATWAQSLADALAWPVRTVIPGYSIYFPRRNAFPRSQVPGTRLLHPGGYDPFGWALWLPGQQRFLRTGEPAMSEPRGQAAVLASRRWGRRIARLLEPAREWRKRRMRKSWQQLIAKE